jgi:AcrR family transcriptional regulator
MFRTIVRIGDSPIPRSRSAAKSTETKPSPSSASRALDGSGISRSSHATKERLLDAAERLFADRGFEGTSMRALAEMARTSVSAANYHFGSKLELVRAVLVRRLEPLNARWLRDLERLEAAAAPGAPALDDVVEAFLRPSFEAWRASEESELPSYRHITAQLHADPHETLAELKVELFGPLLDRYVEALQRVLPDQGPAEIRLGLQLVVGMLVHVVGGQIRIRDADRGSDSDDEALLRRMVRFSAAGLRCEVPASPTSPASRAIGGGP